MKTLENRDLVVSESLSRTLTARQRRKDRASSRKARIAFAILLGMIGLDVGIYLFAHH